MIKKFSIKIERKYIIGVSLLVVAAVFYLVRPTKQPEYRTDISELAEDPEWMYLQHVRSTVTAPEFSHKLQRYYAVGNSWEQQLAVQPDGIYSVAHDRRLLYSFSGSTGKNRYWRSKEQIGPLPAQRPLEGIKITLDPGHIGGKCAKLEERWFKIGNSLPVMEGEMTLLVAQLIAPRLESLGAIVSLTRDQNKPVTRLRTPHFMALARAKVDALDRDPKYTVSYAEKMFYRTAEIRARAALINERLQPDMVVALHFNAEAWGDPADPTLTENNHFHILVNGAYTAGEIKRADQQYEMIQRILEGTIDEEIALSEAFVRAFKQHTQLPPYMYEPHSKRAIPVDEEGYVWARNLLANRLFQCPTIFLEPYVMNSRPVFDRVQMGDYEGTRFIDGQERKSIFREYADAVVQALTDYYSN